MTSGNGTGLVKLSIAECMVELKAFRQVLENAETTNRAVLDKLETRQRTPMVFEENQKKVTEICARGDQLVQKLEDRDKKLQDLTNTVSDLCGKVDGLLSDVPSIKHISRQKRRKQQVINNTGSNISVQALNKQVSRDRQITDTGHLTPCGGKINTDVEGLSENLPPVTVNSRGYKRRLTDDKTDNRLKQQTDDRTENRLKQQTDDRTDNRLRQQTDDRTDNRLRQQSNTQVNTLPQTATQSKPETVNIERRVAVVQESRQSESGNNSDTKLALERKRGDKAGSGLSGLLSTETPTMPGLDECDEEKMTGLGLNSYVAYHVFQKWFSYAETEKVIGSVSGLARGRGPDTVLCLDTSDSMKGEPFQQMIEFAMNFVTGVETLKGIINIEENISVTTIGAVTKVWIHMTSDYSAVKETLREIRELGPGGRSPIAGGLLVALAGCLGNGKSMSVGDVSISPRIVLISDGKGTPDHIKSGPDMTGNSNVNTPARSIVDTNLKDVCDNLKRRHNKVYCIPVGDADKSVLDKISKTTSGKVFLPTQIDRFLRTMDKTIAAAQLLARVIVTLGYIPPGDGMRLLFERAHGLLSEEDTTEVLELAHIFAEELPDHLITTEHDDELPALGTRVRRGPGWKYQDQDSRGVGTVCSHGKNGKVWVEWDNKHRDCYDYKNETKDVQVANEPKVLQSDELIATGCRVTRSDTWPYGNEDGGPGSVGMVIRVFPHGTVIVRWQNKTLSNLKFGHDGEFEVKICTGESHSLQDRQEPRPVQQSDSIYIGSGLSTSIGDMNRRNRTYQQ